MLKFYKTLHIDNLITARTLIARVRITISKGQRKRTDLEYYGQAKINVENNRELKNLNKFLNKGANKLPSILRT